MAKTHQKEAMTSFVHRKLAAMYTNTTNCTAMSFLNKARKVRPPLGRSSHRLSHAFGMPRIQNQILHMAVSILFFARNGTRDNFFELFAKVFRRFRPRGNFFDGPKIFQILADSAAIRLVQKSSKSEPSSRFFSHLKFRKSLPVSVLPKFPRRIQNRNSHI